MLFTITIVTAGVLFLAFDTLDYLKYFALIGLEGLFLTYFAKGFIKKDRWYTVIYALLSAVYILIIIKMM